MGRPTKREGNPQHPAALVAPRVPSRLLSWICMIQIDLRPLKMWTPQHLVHLLENFTQQLGLQGLKDGSGLRILTRTVTSPLKVPYFPKSSSVSNLNGTSRARKQRRLQCGGYGGLWKARQRVLRFDKANVILSIDSDFANSGEACARYARDFSANRRVRDGQKTMNRLYMVESSPTATGSSADHRWAMGTVPLPLQIAGARA